MLKHIALTKWESTHTHIIAHNIFTAPIQGVGLPSINTKQMSVVYARLLLTTTRKGKENDNRKQDLPNRRPIHYSA
jgi:hypothetical protein